MKNVFQRVKFQKQQDTGIIKYQGLLGYRKTIKSREAKMNMVYLRGINFVVMGSHQRRYVNG